MSYRMEVKVRGEHSWIPNGMAFATKSEAEAYAIDLCSRWTSTIAHRVVESDQEPNYRWVDGAAQPIVPATERAE